jgi:serine/threonine protein kinase
VTSTVAASERRWRFDREAIAPGRVTGRRLGGGGEFEVFEVHDAALGRAAAKVVRPDRLAASGPLRRLAREADLLESLAHPHLPRLLDRGMDAAAPHIVIELVEGPTLRRVIKEHGPVEAHRLVPVAVAVARTLDHLHVSGHVHLDVKPGNVMPARVPKLIDLGLARSVAMAARLTSTAGTNAFLAPEQCLCNTGPVIGPPADVWGLGVTMYEALSGHRPFRAVDWKAVPAASYPQVSETPRPLRAAVSSELDGLVMACLSADPAARPTAAEVVDRLVRGS